MVLLNIKNNYNKTPLKHEGIKISRIEFHNIYLNKIV